MVDLTLTLTLGLLISESPGFMHRQRGHWDQLSFVRPSWDHGLVSRAVPRWCQAGVWEAAFESIKSRGRSRDGIR